MNTMRRLFCAGLSLIALTSSAFAQDRVPGKLFVVSVAGKAQCTQAEKVVPLTANEVFITPGARFETGEKSRASLVLSNNTGLLVAANTRFTVERFEQAPFVADPERIDEEPSLSTLELTCPQGELAFCFPKPLFGSAALIKVPQATLKIQGKRIITRVSDVQTIVFILEGRATILSGPEDQSGTVAETGQKATIVQGVGNQFPIVEITSIDRSETDRLTEAVAAACLARRSVLFAKPDDPRRILPPPGNEPTPTISIDRIGSN